MVHLPSWFLYGSSFLSALRCLLWVLRAKLLQSCLPLSNQLWTAGRQAPLSLGVSCREHGSGLLCPHPGLTPVPFTYTLFQLCCLPGLSIHFFSAAAAAAKSLQSSLTLCDPIDGSPPGSPVPGILQERTLEWVAISFSNAWKWKVKVKSLTVSDSSLRISLTWLEHFCGLKKGYFTLLWFSFLPPIRGHSIVTKMRLRLSNRIIYSFFAILL